MIKTAFSTLCPYSFRVNLLAYSQFKTLCLDVIAHENPETMVDNEKTITLTPDRFIF